MFWFWTWYQEVIWEPTLWNMKVSLKGYIMMKILFACIFIYIHVYVYTVLLLVFINSRKLSSSKAERKEKQCVINRPDSEMWLWLPKLRAELSQCCLYFLACFLPVAAKHREEGEHLKVICRSFLSGASCSRKNEGRLEGFVVLKKISQLYCVTLETSLSLLSHL